MERFDNRNRKFQNQPIESLKRQPFGVNLRKKKRNDYNIKFALSKISTPTKMDEDLHGPTDSDEDLEANTSMYDNLDFRFINDSISHDPKRVLGILMMTRQVLSQAHPPIKLFVEKGVVDFAINFAKPNNDIEIRTEATWILCNIASSSGICVEELVKKGVIAIFCDVLEENNEVLYENAIWGLGNIMAESKENFLLVKKNHILDKMLKICRKTNDVLILKVISWTMKNIAHYDEYIDKQNSIKFLQIADKLLDISESPIQNNIVFSLGVFIRSDNQKVQLVIEAGLLKKCFQFWEDPAFSLCLIKFSANICSGTSEQTQAILDLGVLDKLLPFTNSTDPANASQVYFALSNVAAGNTSQLLFLESHPIFYTAINGILSINEMVRLEASYMLSNFIKLAPDSIKRKLFNGGLISLIIQSIDCRRSEFLINMLNVFEEFLKVMGHVEFFASDLDKVIEGLQTHNSHEVYLKCIKILEEDLMVKV